MRPIRDENLFLCVILENIVNLGQKVRNRRLVRSEDLSFFFRNHWILETKSALLGTISSDDSFFFFRDHCSLRKKSALPETISDDDLFFWRSLDFENKKCITREQFEFMTFFV